MYGSVIIFGKAKAEVGVVPFQSGTLTYNGSEQSPAWNGFNAAVMDLSGTTSAVNAGTYTAVFTLKEGYVWSDGGTEAKSVAWTIGRASLAVPLQKDALAYTGNEQSPVWSNYDSSKMTMGGTTSGTNAGSYTAIFTPKANYQWSDGTTEAKSVAWTIGKAGLTVPSQSEGLIYTGSEQSPTWNNYDSGEMTMGGTTKGTNAGTYTATFTPKTGYQWSDGTTTAKSVSWSIGKAAGSLSLDKTSMSLDVSTLTGTIAVTRAGDGAVTATSSNTNVAMVSVSGTVVTVTAKAKGSATITISVAAGTNHMAPTSKTCSVTAELPSTTLADNTPATIQAAARAGTAANYWSVGDRIGIALNGTVGGLTLNSTYYAFILGFDHNSSREGSKSIHFQFGKTSDGTDIAFVQSEGSKGTGFCMNTTITGDGGWEDSYMRKTICAEFLAAMPTAWRNVIAACYKYSDNVGRGNGNGNNSGTLDDDVTGTSDKIWLLSEFEVFGTRSWANRAEQNYQKQYDYYKNGNSKVKSGSIWWLRSAYEVNSGYFCTVRANGDPYNHQAWYSLGFAPCFMVA